MSAPSFQQVQVVEISADGTYAIVANVAGSTFNVLTHVRYGGVGFPQPGETWLINRPFGQWTFAAKVNTDPVPVITAGPEDESPLVLQLLAAMHLQGVVANYTQAEDALLGDDPPDLPASDVDGDGEPDTPDEVPQGRYHDLWVVSWNCGGSLRGDRSLKGDLDSLSATRADLIGLQEYVGNRDALTAHMAARGFGLIHDETSGTGGPEWNALFYKTKVLAVTDYGQTKIASRPSGGVGVSRWAQWGQFDHLPSGHALNVINTHLSPPGRHAGAYYTDQVAAVGDLIDARFAAAGPVLLIGSVNADWRDPAILAQAGYPYAEWGTHGLTPCWQYATPPSDYGSFGQALPDAVWRKGTSGQAVIRKARVLTGYGAAHKPVLVQVQMREPTA